MTEPIDQYFYDCIERWRAEEGAGPEARGPAESVSLSVEDCLAYFDAQLQSRHLDFAARWLQSKGQGFYTIGSSGHESNAAIAMALRPDDPALLHYRSGGFFAARAAQVAGSTPIRDVLLGMAAGSEDPISGGRHKVFGHPALSVIPQTSTIGSHLPRAIGLAFSVGAGARPGVPLNWPADAVVVTSLGDASVNHSTVAGALNATDYCAHRGLDMPLLIVCEDNGVGISTRSPSGWVAAALSRYATIAYAFADGADPHAVLTTARGVVDWVRTSRRPAIIHLRTVRIGGHAGSDAELAYRSRAEIRADFDRDPLLATAELMLRVGMMSVDEVSARYEQVRTAVMTEAAAMIDTPRLDSPERVMRPISRTRPGAVRSAAVSVPVPESRMLTKSAPENQGVLTLAQSITSALGDVLATWPQAVIFGEDVARKGGVYGLTRTLAKRFGPSRVFDTILDEQTILGTALGSALNGKLPLPEIQYLAYLHNAEDQLRGEAATLAFFSNDQYHNGMVVRIAGLAYQRGFGGHFHNDNSVAVLRDIPGIIVAVPSHPADAPAMLRTCVALAQEEHRVCVFLEPIALYHARDLHEPGDELWTSTYDAPDTWPDNAIDVGEVGICLEGDDLLLVTFGNGLPMSLRAAEALLAVDIRVTVLDLRWLSPLPVDAVLDWARRFNHVLVVDETRRTGGVSEGVIASLVDQNYLGHVRRVTSRDSLIPLGPAADQVLLSEEDIIEAARSMLGTQIA